MSGRAGRAGFVAAAFATMVWATTPAAVAAAPDDPAPRCAPGADPVLLTGTVDASMAKTYEVLPFSVARGTTRVEVGYSWTPAEDTTLDLGLWDADGYRSPDGFRGWGGSRQGRLDKGMERAWVQADDADRAFLPGEIEPGTWYVELGYAEVAPAGAEWTVELRCDSPPTGAAAVPDPVDPDHVARDEPGWYRGDFHMHSWSSLPTAPDHDGFVRYGRDAGLDFMPMTEYVTTRHWGELGAVQRANPDVLLWPGREVITYFGHAIVLGETPSVVEFRHGFEDVTLGEVQTAAVRDGALFGLAHPTVFPEDEFGSACRGCEFQLGPGVEGGVDLGRVDTVEIVTGQIAYGTVQNPFVSTAIEFWEQMLRDGHKVTAVSGSDDKDGPELGSSATAVYAERLSRRALSEGIRAGHAYVQMRGARDSPELDLTAPGPGGTTLMMGDTVVGDRPVAITATVTGGEGQRLRVVRDGVEVEVVDVTSSPFTHTFTAARTDDEGPLGTFWRVETFDDVSLTAVANPIFLADREPELRSVLDPAPWPARASGGEPVGSTGVADSTVPVGWTVAAVGAIAALAAVGVVARRRGARSDNGAPGGP